ncbi:hypothetical protein P376_2332 [Streptomyces sp. HCCB10043]|nr:hypothetical protein P376_2332 [Streptomyces sp. HCCB10043]EWS92224.1 hypothetical protein SSIG_07237 [Streptomyces filamentosus NRRL 11379]
MNEEVRSLRRPPLRGGGGGWRGPGPCGWQRCCRHAPTSGCGPRCPTLPG